VPISDGAYTTTVTDDTSTKPNIRNEVHAMERPVLIQYAPDLPEEDQLALKGVFDEEPGGMLLFPYSAMPYEVAISAWTNQVLCPTYDAAVLDVARNFRDTYLGNGPEQGIPLNLSG
jgi:hypothetical protein